MQIEAQQDGPLHERRHRPPFRTAFDNARDPYTARNALGITGTNAPVNAQYITAAVDPTLTAERVLTNTATVTWDFATAGQAKATATGFGNVSNSGTPTSGQYGKWVTATTIQGVAPATVLSDIGAQPAGSYQPLDAELTAIAGLTSAADQAPYFTGSGTAAVTTVTAAARTVLDDTTTAAMLTTLGAAPATDFPSGAWSAWTPTITATSGTITSTTINTARYTRHGKAVMAYFDIMITNAGSGSGSLVVTLPIAASGSSGGFAVLREIATIGAMGGGYIGPGTSNTALATYANATLIATNARVVGSMMYEGA